ncbi:phytoene desaturase family protein [Puniceicoccus vermicola]|uniref:Phytoene desaturase n=1 Tax=Puniceicoccus vermicola TaxID=388746 RepID=A0A7X1AUV8_9BACT|nr:phytoene desaturase family protein [Puniceicoccus vermicola]MBC2600458.1 phytoene desaturase [Puniceicoccus vermicola]
MSSSQYDSLVIGGGFGGLSAACRIAAAGKSVRLLEKNSHLGGKCDYFERDGFRFDLGPSVLTLPFVLDDLFQSVGRDRRDYLEIEPVEPGCSYFFSDGSRFDAPGTMDDFESAIAESFPDEIDGFRRFRAYITRLWEVSGPAFLFNPPGLPALRSIPWAKALRALPDFLPGRMEPRLRKYFRDPRLIQLFSRFATYNGSDPHQTPAIFNVVAYAELAFGSWRCRGGMYALVQALEKLAGELGVGIETNAEVDRVSFDSQGRVTGVSLSDGEMLQSPSVICNQDTLQSRTGPLLADHPAHSQQARRTARKEASSSGFVILMALQNRHPDLACHNVFFPGDYREEFHALFTEPRPLPDPTLYLSRPSATEPHLAPEGKEGWFVLVNAPSLQKFQNWENDAYASRVIEQLLQRYPIDPEEIEWSHYHGPTFYQESYRAWNGSLYGMSSNTQRQAFLRSPNRDRRCPGLFYAGGSAHPGGGIPLALLSGNFAADACLSFLDP